MPTTSPSPPNTGRQIRPGKRSPIRIMFMLLSLVVAMAASLLGPASPAGACSCIGFDDALKMGDAAVVFTGTVIDEEPQGDQFGGGNVALLFDVDQIFKGRPGSQVLVNSPSGGSASCGVSDRGPMVVLAYSDGESLNTSLCSTAAESAEVIESLVATFGPSTEAAPATGQPLDDRSLPLIAGIGIALFAVSLAGAVVAVARPGKKP